MVNYVTLDFLKDARAEGSERTNEQINMNENGWMNDFVSSSPNFQLEHCIRTLVETRCRLETVLTSAKGLEQGFFPLERILELQAAVALSSCQGEPRTSIAWALAQAAHCSHKPSPPYSSVKWNLLKDSLMREDQTAQGPCLNQPWARWPRRELDLGLLWTLCLANSSA
jgi:hypothetical protein